MPISGAAPGTRALAPSNVNAIVSFFADIFFVTSPRSNGDDGLSRLHTRVRISTARLQVAAFQASPTTWSCPVSSPDGAGSAKRVGADLTPEVTLRVIIHGAAGLGHTSGEEKRMTKADLVEKVADVVGPRVTKRKCRLMVKAFLEAVKDALARGDRIELRGFGVFKVRHRKARTGRNPRTTAPVEVPYRDVPVFEPSRHLRNRADRSLGVLGKEARWEVVREPWPRLRCHDGALGFTLPRRPCRVKNTAGSEHLRCPSRRSQPVTGGEIECGLWPLRSLFFRSTDVAAMTDFGMPSPLKWSTL